MFVVGGIPKMRTRYAIIENKNAWTPSYEIGRVDNEAMAKFIVADRNKHSDSHFNGAKYSYMEVNE
jgi:hypothetical protein